MLITCSPPKRFFFSMPYSCSLYASTQPCKLTSSYVSSQIFPYNSSPQQSLPLSFYLACIVSVHSCLHSCLSIFFFLFKKLNTTYNSTLYHHQIIESQSWKYNRATCSNIKWYLTSPTWDFLFSFITYGTVSCSMTTTLHWFSGSYPQFNLFTSFLTC